MPSATEPIGPAKSPNVPRFRARFERWNRKLHFYAGLFLLFFMWLFAISGLLLNHPTWSFAESWTKRTDANSERAITALGPELRGEREDVCRLVSVAHLLVGPAAANPLRLSSRS